MQAPRARIIVVNYNSGPLLARCVAQLVRQTEARFELVIVDNASRDGSLEGLPDDPRLTIIRSPRNLGFAAGNNLGFAGCTAPYVALINPDAFAAPDWLEALLTAADAAPAFCMFGALLRQADRPELLDGAGDAYACFGTFWRGGHGQAVPEIAPEGEVFGPSAAAALYRSADFAAAGGFDDSYFCYAEDVDLAFRLRLAGGRGLQVGAALADHIGSATTGAQSDFTRYHLVRNGIWTFVKCMPGPLLVALAPAHLAFIAWNLWQARKTDQAALVARAVRDAVAGLPAIWRKRRTLQKARRISWLACGSALVWSFACVRARAIVAAPVSAGERGEVPRAGRRAPDAAEREKA